MGQEMKKLLLYCIVFIVLIIAWVYFFGIKIVPDEEYADFNQLVSRAVDAGDVAAAEELYESYASHGYWSQARQWALIGAINNSDYLIDRYVDLYKILPDELKRSDEVILNKNLHKTGAKKLVAKLGAK